MLTMHTLGQEVDDQALATKAAAFTHDSAGAGACRTQITQRKLATFLATIPENVRTDFAFIELHQSLQGCGIEFGGDCGLWDALELSYGHALAERPTGCPREASIEASLLAARCAGLPCKMPPLKAVRCWWLYALGGAVLGMATTAVVYRRKRQG